MNPLLQFDSPRQFENDDGSVIQSTLLAKLGPGLTARQEPRIVAPGERTFLVLDAVGVKPKELSITLSYEELLGLDDGVVEFSKDTAAAIPAGSRLFGASIEDAIEFNDFGEGLVVIRFGPISFDNQFFNEVTVSDTALLPGSPLEPGTYQGMRLTEGPCRLTITDNSANDLNDCIAGSVTVNLFYF